MLTRFAPSPTGLLHLGHAYSALFAAQKAGEGGEMLLRLEDLDRSRVRPEYAEAIFEDLRWLGLNWPEPVLYQSERQEAYAHALEQLKSLGLLYPCFCTRAQIQAELALIQTALHEIQPPYPGTCRNIPPSQAWERAEVEPHALRLNLGKALEQVAPPRWQELSELPNFANPQALGDVVLARKDGAIAYHLAVVVDDAFQEIELVTRGEDLHPQTTIHRILQDLLGLPAPKYWHHRLIADEQGKRLAKRHDALSLQSLRDQGVSAEEIMQRLQAQSSLS